jgi:FAD synthetase
VADKHEKRKVVLASGVFDLLHLGHVKFLEEAKKAGGKNAELIVIIARDSTVQKTKGRKPIMPEGQRRMLVESLKVVDKAVLGFENFDLAEVINRIKPDVIALGYDQAAMEQQVCDYVHKHGLNMRVVQVGKFEEDELNSSSKIRQRIVEKSADD